MVENKQQDVRNRAYAMLSSLRQNIDQMTSDIPETYVHEFHTALTKLEGIGIDVSEFRIPDSEIAPRVITIRTLTFKDSPKGGVDYSKEKYVARSFILTKLDAILAYLGSITSKKPKKMGFPLPDTQ